MRKSLVFLFSIACLGLEVAPAANGDETTEQYVRRQIKAGRVADLEMRFPKDERARVLKPEFIEEILAQKVGGHRLGIQIKKAIFVEPLDLKRIDVSSPVALTGCDFRDSVDLSYAHFHSSFDLSGSHFKRSFNAPLMVVDSYFLATDAEFHGPVSLNSAHIAGIADLGNSLFKAGANFVVATVGGSFVASGSHFADTGENQDHWATFNSMKVGQHATLEQATFDGNTDFSQMQIGSNFEAVGTKFTNSRRTVLFGNMDIRSAFILRKVAFAGWLRVNGLTATDLDLWDVAWPPPERFDLADVSYKNISVLQSKPRLSPGTDQYENRIADWPGRPRYSPAIYAGLAHYLDEHGQSQLASQIRIDNQLQEGSALSFPRWAWNRFKFLVVAYGEHPELGFAWSALFVGVGFFVFRRETGMEVVGEKKDAPKYQPFWYSLGLFLPVVDLGQTKAWRPARKRIWASNYAQVHVLLGWLFIPIALAAVTGLLK